MDKKISFGLATLAVVAVIGAGSVALAAGNGYANFRSVMGNRAQAINEKNFDRFSEMHRLMADGDYQGAQKIRTELGLGRGRGNGGGCPIMGGGRGQGRVGGCPMADGQDFVDKNNNGICDYMENLNK